MSGDEHTVDLEIRIAHQENLIQELSDVLARQWMAIDTLTRKVERLEDRLRRVEGGLEDLAPAEPPPPHY